MGVLSIIPCVKMNCLGKRDRRGGYAPKSGSYYRRQTLVRLPPGFHDKLMANLPSSEAHADAFCWRIFNNDGSEAGACGAMACACGGGHLFKESRNPCFR